MFSLAYQNNYLLLSFISIYLLFFILGILTAKNVPRKLAEFIKKSDELSVKKVKEKVGNSSEKIKSGDKKIFLKTALTVWRTNTLAIFLISVSSMLFFPLVFTLLYSPYQQGVTIRKARPSSFMSGFSYFFMASLEWITYPVSIFTGVQFSENLILLITRGNINISEIVSGYLFFLACSIVILFIQSFLEIHYVKKVLEKGKSAIPLMPY